MLLRDRDMLFVLTINGDTYKKKLTTNFICKIVFLQESKIIDLNDVVKKLNFMGIQKLNIFSINTDDSEDIKTFTINELSQINYIELSIIGFVKMLNEVNPNEKDLNFKEYNKNCLYILREGDYKLLKDLIKNIEGHNINIGKGGNQKCHVLDPLELRLSSYLMAFFKFNYNYISYINNFY
jgi:hypothetical protein